MKFVIWCKGVEISQREDDRFKYVLFQVFGFYAEVVYNKKQQLVNEFRIFDSSEYLDPYLDNINIKELTGNIFPRL